MASIPSNGYREVMSGTNNYTGTNSFDASCPKTPVAPVAANDLTNKQYVDGLVVGGGNLQTTLDAGNTATGANANITLTDTQQGGALNPILTLNNTNATGSVAMEIYKNKPTAGVAGDVLFNQSVWGKDSGNARQEYTRITHTIRDSATGGEDGSIEMGCFVQGSINTFLQLNGNENEVNLLKTLDTNGNAILSRTGNITLDTGFNNTGDGNIVINSVGAIGLGNIEIKAKSLNSITGQSVSMVSAFGTDVAAVATNNTGLLQISATQGINITGNALQAPTSSGSSGQYLVITLNGLPYKIPLDVP
jgi:hypothetical protein